MTSPGHTVLDGYLPAPLLRHRTLPGGRIRAAEALRSAVRGTVITPADNGFETARLAWNLAVDQQPSMVVEAEDVFDLVTAVRVARSFGMSVSAQPIGHGATRAVDGTVLLRTTALRDLSVDVVGRAARVEAGVRWRDLLAALDGTGLTALAGSSADPTVVGYTLGGGLSWFSRRYGLAANSVVAVEMIDPDGRHVRVTAASDPELFWALRGGGGDFGIVTAMEFDLHPAEHIYGGRLLWPVEHAPEVLRTYRDLTVVAPKQLSLWAWLFEFPDLPFLPEPMRGAALVGVDAAYLGSTAEGEKVLAALRAVATPVMDTFGSVPIGQLSSIAFEPEDPVPAMTTSMLLTELDDDAIDDLLAVAGPGAGLPLAAVGIRHLGGALSRVDPAHGAAGHVSEPYLLFAGGVVADPAMVDPLRAAFGRLHTALKAHRSSRQLLNFLSDDADAGAAFPPAVLASLQGIKRRRDPNGVIRSNHPVFRPVTDEWL